MPGGDEFTGRRLLALNRPGTQRAIIDTARRLWASGFSLPVPTLRGLGLVGSLGERAFMSGRRKRLREGGGGGAGAGAGGGNSTYFDVGSGGAGLGAPIFVGQRGAVRRRRGVRGPYRARRRRAPTRRRKGSSKRKYVRKRKTGSFLRRRSTIMRRKSTRKRTSWTEKVRRAVHKDSESPGMMFHMKKLQDDGGGGSFNVGYEMVPYLPSDRYAVLTQQDLYAPPGLDPSRLLVHTTSASRRDWDFRCGSVMLPFNMTVTNAGFHDQKYPVGGVDTHSYSPRFNGLEYQPMYCAFDYGWFEGPHFRTHFTDAEVEVVFGIIKNVADVRAFCDDDDAVHGEGRQHSLAEAINMSLGPKGDRDWSLSTGSLPRRSFPKTVNDAAMDVGEWEKVRRRLKRDIKILKRHTYQHRPVIKDAVDGPGGGHEDVSEAELGRMYGGGSFTFPRSELKKQRLNAALETPADAEWGYQGALSAPEYMHTEKDIPFMLVRGMAECGKIISTAEHGQDPPSGRDSTGKLALVYNQECNIGSANTPGQDWDTGDDALKFYCRVKLKIADP